MIKLANTPKDKSISVLEMKDGDVGVIVAWARSGTSHEYVGALVQKYHNTLIILGRGDGWTNFQSSLASTERVRLLEEGETLVFTKK